MDGSTFDHLTKTLAVPGSRRRTLGGLLAGGFGLLGIGAEHAATKKKKPCPPCKKRKKGKCKGRLPDGTGCPGGTCQSGSCVATPPPVTCGIGQKPCNGGCIASNLCCVDTDCAPDAPRCCRGTCVPSTRCCTNADCTGGKTCQNGGCACPAGSPPCGDICCTAPAGFTPYSISCNTAGGTPTCSCSYDALDNPSCGTGCRSCGWSDACTQEGALSGCDFCGCTPPSVSCGTADACKTGTAPCGNGGSCFQPLGGGSTRCGTPTTTGSCGCTSHQQCVTNHGAGAFCVTFASTSTSCTCGAGGSTTFCAVPG